MSVLSGESISRMKVWADGRPQAIFEPLVRRSRHQETNTSYGLSMCGYDIRLDQDVAIYPGFTTLASTLERFSVPFDAVEVMHDKSTWARLGVQVQNTVAEPGWRGYLTLELTLHPVIPIGASWWKIFWMRQLLAAGLYPPMRLRAGTPIAQVLCHEVDKKTSGYGDGKYQNQSRGPQEAR